MSDMGDESEYDDTEMTHDEFERRVAFGQPVTVYESLAGYRTGSSCGASFQGASPNHGSLPSDPASAAVVKVLYSHYGFVSPPQAPLIDAR